MIPESSQKRLGSNTVIEASVARYAQWRLYTAHAAELMSQDGTAYTSLARQVCDNEESLSVSRGQAEAHVLFARYLGGDGQVAALAPGTLLCAGALFVWFMTSWAGSCSSARGLGFAQ